MDSHCTLRSYSILCNGRDKYEVTSDNLDREMARSGLRTTYEEEVIVFMGISGDLMPGIFTLPPTYSAFVGRSLAFRSMSRNNIKVNPTDTLLCLGEKISRFA